MTISSKSVPRLRYHPNAYRFVSAALPYAQQLVKRTISASMEDESATSAAPNCWKASAISPWRISAC